MAHIENDKAVILNKKYIKIPTRKSKSRLSSLIQSMVMYEAKKPRQRPAVDLIEEYELIQLKKSKLSRSDRYWVEIEFKKNFVEIK